MRPGDDPIPEDLPTVGHQAKPFRSGHRSYVITGVTSEHWTVTDDRGKVVADISKRDDGLYRYEQRSHRKHSAAATDWRGLLSIMLR